MINEFVEKILVHQAEGKGASRTQEVEIFFNFVGKVEIPHEEIVLTEEEKAALAEQERRRAKKPNTTAAIWRKNADNGENSGNGSRNKSPMNFPLSQTRKEKKAHEKID